MSAPLPCSPEAEEAILSCILFWPESAGDIFKSLPAEAFHHHGNRVLFTTLAEMFAEGHPLQLAAVTDRLRDSGRLEAVGGPFRLSEIGDHVPTRSTIGYYSTMLVDRWKQREIAAICTETATAALSLPQEGNIDEWLGSLTERILALSVDRQQRKERSFKEICDSALERYEEAIKNKGRLNGASTGFRQLDAVTGGHHPGQLWIIGGGTSDGKSAIAQQIALSTAKAGVHVGFYTLEMPDDEIADRYYAMESQVDSSLFKQGFTQRAQIVSCMEANKTLRTLPITIRDVSGIKLTALIADIRALSARGARHFVVDYGQLIESESKSRSREEEVARVSRSLKAAAKQLRVSIDLLSQLNDDGKLRESRALGFDADVVLTLSCPITREKQNGEFIDVRQENRRLLHVGKNRNGQRGVSIPLAFHGSTFTFSEERP